jgi:tetraacyldisaccharide 4'-kinase
MAHSAIKLYPVLQPFAFLYAIGVSIRNLLFDWKALPSEQYPVPIICIGNLAVGGTGKTPMVEYLIRLLCDTYRVAVLSRGYKRKSSGYVLADEQSTSADIGDEPCQMKQKYPQVIVSVDRNRRRGMKHLLAMPEDVRPQVVLLDDAYQHRYVKPSFSILITDYNRLFYHDRLLPAGRLREPAKSVSRADMILVSKCPDDLSLMDCRMIEQQMHLRPHQLLSFTGISYQQLKGVFPEECAPFKIENIQKEDGILLITGIANPAPIIAEMHQYTDNVSIMSFSDHHEFTKKDIDRMKSVLSTMTGERPLIICTEKDAARIRHNPFFPDEWKSHLYYLPMQVCFLYDRHEQFKNVIMQHISSMI